MDVGGLISHNSTLKRRPNEKPIMGREGMGWEGKGREGK